MKSLKTSAFIIPLSFLLIAMFPSSRAAAQQRVPDETGIMFSTRGFKQVLADAKAGHKKIFVDAYASWCAPCRALRSTTFRDKKAANYFNKNFINVSVDVEKGEGIELAKKWQIEGLPTLLILDERGNILANHVGYIDGSGLLEFAKEAAGK